ncbi:MAG TPA: histidine kinase, partial [Nocardioidaceae bacterium]|nr:histidine kinase [Nocardioidaceae bacterium]
MEPQGRRVLVWALTWPLAPLLLAATAACDLVDDDKPIVVASDLPLVLAMGACWVVGVVVTARAPGQPAGWGFLGLGTAMAWSGLADVYGDLGYIGGHDLPAWRLASTFGDSSFVWWFVFLALVVQYTIPAQIDRGLPRWLPRLTIVSGVVFQVMALLRSTNLDPPRSDLRSPLAVDALDGPAKLLAAIAIYLLGLVLIASVVLLVRAFRRSTGETRQQLLWVVAGAVPLVPCIVGSFAVSAADRNDLAGLFIAIAITTLITGAGLSVLRYRLYDVERVVTESAAYAIAAVSVIAAFVAVVIVVSRTTPASSESPGVTVAATLVGVAVARLSFIWGRRAVGRRVNPVRFEAVDAVRSGLAGATHDLDGLMVEVLGGGARVTYPDVVGGWVTSEGRPVSPGPNAVDVRRRGELVARLEYDPVTTDLAVVEAVAAEAAAEMDNVALRAELARQVELIHESRARLANAHLEERRRIERDLHDGAQQRLLGMALQLRGALLNGDGRVLADEADRTISELQVTVQELRDLAAGLQPAALSAGGLLAAVTDLAARAPVTVRHDVVDERFSPSVEGTAWFVVSEAFTNAVKHSGT